MLSSGAGFATAFTALLTPFDGEGALTARFPQAETTLRNIDHYHELMGELRDAVQPELELVDARVTAPLKEYQELLKKIRKTITKREHKLVDFDRHNNSYSKLKDKKEKSLSDEKNLFKYEQELELATQEYEHYNNMLKAEIPHFLALSTSLITPIFQTFYYIEVGVLYTLLEKMQAFTGQTYGDLSVEGLETMHFERSGDAPERIEGLSITKRFTSTARFMSQHRTSSGSSAAPSSTLGRTASYSSSSTGTGYGAVAGSTVGAPPPAYTPPAAGAGAAGGAAGAAGKRAPPPPPGRPGAQQREYVTALYDYAATRGMTVVMLAATAPKRAQMVHIAGTKSIWSQAAVSLREYREKSPILHAMVDHVPMHAVTAEKKAYHPSRPCSLGASRITSPARSPAS
ncbi:hypothetical protein DMC30DRAFT_451839, partial [Rhodotorula diobovata]